MTSVILLIVGLYCLWQGTLFTVRGAVLLSERFGLSQGFVGLAVLAVGTDLPELVVALSASAQQLQGIEASGVIVGSAFGSTIAQGTVVLGVAGLFGYLPVAPRMIRRDGVALILAIGVAALMVFDGVVTRGEGAVMMLAYALYFVALIQAERKGKKLEREAAPEGRLSAAASIAVGLTVVTVGAHLVVSNAVGLASAFGVSQTLLGVLVVGVGTSLPELALSIRAALERRASLSVGNVIGSNIFDLLIPVGVAAMLSPLSVERSTIVIDFPTLAIATPLLLFFLIRRRGLQRGEAMILIALYLTYVGIRVALA
jgi:cation:H+ antiporter